MLSTAKKIALTPYYLAEVFSQAKSFRDNPVLGSRVLNRLGLHVARVVLAHAVVRLRRTALFWLVPAAQRRAFARDGYLKFENFLPAEDFAALKAEIAASRAEVRKMQQGDTATVTLLLDDAHLADLPECRKLIFGQRLLRPTAYVGARWKHPLAFLHAVKNANAAGRPDPQKALHSDTFHSTMKGWLFLDDVTEEIGPFTFAPGSHRLSWARLKWEYARSVEGAATPERLAARGSLRVAEDDLGAMGVPPLQAMTVPANTLVIADTNGFHRRGDVARPCSRMAIYVSSRSNPFNPWPGLPLRAWRRLEHWARDQEYRWADEKAAKAGGRPTWRRAPGAELHVDPGAGG